MTEHRIPKQPYLGEGSEEINKIVQVLKIGKNRVKKTEDAVLYLGFNQMEALDCIESRDIFLERPTDTRLPLKFCGWEIVEVKRLNYCRLI